MTKLTPELINELFESTSPVQETKISTVGKLFLAAMAGYVVGRNSGYKVRGTPQEIAAVKNALESSRKFREELSVPGASVDSVIDKLNLKRASAKQFEKILGVPWPL